MDRENNHTGDIHPASSPGAGADVDANADVDAGVNASPSRDDTLLAQGGWSAMTALGGASAGQTGGAGVAPDVADADVDADHLTGTPTSTPPRARLFGLPEPTILTLKDLRDLPGQILPEETVHHLRNAAREAALAALSLWRNINKTASAGQGEKVRKHIDVE